MAYRVGWTISFEGKAFCESDLTLADTIRALEIAGGTWADLHPLTGPQQFVGLLVAFLVICGEDQEQALRRVVRIRYVDALEMVTAGETAVATEERRQANPDDEGGDSVGDRTRPEPPAPVLTGGATREV